MSYNGKLLSESLSFELLFALSVTCLLINGFLLIQIKFGGQSVTTWSMKPYWVSLCIFTLMTMEFLWICFLENVEYRNHEDSFLNNLLKPNGDDNHVESNIMQIKKDLMVVFVFCVAFELENLLVFVNFQRKLRLQDLNVERDVFVRLEKRISKIWVITATLALAPNLFTLWGFVLFEPELDLAFSDDSIWWFFLF